MFMDKAGAKCHLNMDAGCYNCHKCCELARNGKEITESQSPTMPFWWGWGAAAGHKIHKLYRIIQQY